jgi:hypothetical protein
MSPEETISDFDIDKERVARVQGMLKALPRKSRERDAGASPR